MDNILLQVISNLDKCYCKYSNFKVSCCLITNSNLYYGVNIENSSYSATLCAERVALSQAILNGENKTTMKELFIIGDSNFNFIYPCGVCLQFISEFCNPEFVITMGRKNLITQDLETKSVFIKDLLVIPFSLENQK